MRIDASNLLIAAQLQPQRAAPAAKAPVGAQFEPLQFAGTNATQERHAASPPGAPQRPGMRLDIKV